MRIRSRQDLSRVQLSDLETQVVRGTTDSTANTEKRFGHSLSCRPLAIVREGNAYIYQVTDSYIDVRSTATSVAFELLLIK